MKSTARRKGGPPFHAQPVIRGVDHTLLRRINSRFQEGVALQTAGRHTEALAIFEEVAGKLESLKISEANIYAAIGHCHLLLANPEESIVYSEKALAIDPNRFEALVNASVACRVSNKLDKAEEYALKAHELKPREARPLGALGAILINKGRVSAGLIHATHALILDSKCSDAIGALALGYSRIGDMETAMPYYEQYLAARPYDAALHSGMLFTMHYEPNITGARLRAMHKEWGDRFAARFKSQWPDHKNKRTADRQLRIGYVSGDFRHHVVSYWTKHVLAAHRRENVEVFCFANNKEDDYSSQIKESADHWISILDTSDADAARLIQEAKIDILVDLSGHTGGHRLCLMARKPAPVQATWCGYLDSTGLEAVDYVIADEVIAPINEPSPFVEEPLRLPSSSVCFEQIPDAPKIGGPPFEKNGFITFGCFNNPAKIGPAIADIWTAILKANPDSKLLLMYGNYKDPFTRERLLRLFRDRDIDQKRIEMRAGSRTQVLATYSEEVDIALDTSPYNGGTTTCEALWMGVPVIGLLGGHPMSRFGCSLLAYSGLTGLIAESSQEYTDRASHLANDTATLARLRRELRPHLANTPVFNSQLFVEGLENAYFGIFSRWRQQQ
jgi:predicted O-linked N-acetylglucosamine transferase (SPINDLY family)